MPNFAGTWKMRSSENFDELLKALGKQEERPRGAPGAQGWAPGPAQAGGSPRGGGEGEGSDPRPPGQERRAEPGSCAPREQTFAGGLAPSPTVRPRLVPDQREGRFLPESKKDEGL